jgi:hypothetical protein
MNYERINILKPKLFISMLVVIFISGCASSAKPKIAPQDFSERSRLIKKVGIMSSGSFIFELGAGNSKELNKEWSAQVDKWLEKVSVDQFRLAGYDARLLEQTELTKQIVTDYNAIPRDRLPRYAYSARALEPPLSENIKTLLENNGIDALVIVRGIDHVSSGGRQATRIVGAVFGVIMSSGIAHEEIVIIDKTPAIIYYNHKSEDGQDLRSESGSAHLFKEIMQDFAE